MIGSSQILSEPYNVMILGDPYGVVGAPCLDTPAGKKCLSRKEENGTEAILLGAAAVANEVRTSRLETISSIQGMQKEVINLNTILIDNYKNHLAAMQKLMLEKINAIAKDPSWSQESYEALKLRLIKDLSVVFETKNE